MQERCTVVSSGNVFQPQLVPQQQPRSDGSLCYQSLKLITIQLLVSYNHKIKISQPQFIPRGSSWAKILKAYEWRPMCCGTQRTVLVYRPLYWHVPKKYGWSLKFQQHVNGVGIYKCAWMVLVRKKQREKSMSSPRYVSRGEIHPHNLLKAQVLTFEHPTAHSDQ